MGAGGGGGGGGRGRGTFDGTNHGPISGPLLGVGEVGLGIQVGGNEETAWVLVDAQLGKLDLVVVYVPVKANHYSPDLQQGERIQKPQGPRNFYVFQGKSHWLGTHFHGV